MSINHVALESIRDNAVLFSEATCVILVKTKDGTTLYVPVNMDDAESDLYKEHLQHLIDREDEIVDEATVV